MIGQPPLVIATHALGGERPKSFNRPMLLGQPETQRKNRGRRRRCIDGVVEIREASLELAKQHAHEQVWRARRSVNHRFPKRNGSLSAWWHDPSLMNPQVPPERGKDRCRSLI